MGRQGRRRRGQASTTTAATAIRTSISYNVEPEDATIASELVRDRGHGVDMDALPHHGEWLDHYGITFTVPAK